MMNILTETKRNGEIKLVFLEDDHDLMELLFIIVGTRQQHRTKQHSREFNKLLHKAASQ